MKSYALCPVSNKKVNERVARINGVFTILLLFISGLTHSIIPLVFLTIDFIIRGYDYSKYSLIGTISKGIVRYFGLSEKVINAGPKIFAARIGFIFCTFITISFLFNALVPYIALAGILGLFSFLETTFGLCVACELYPFLYGFLYKAKFQ